MDSWSLVGGSIVASEDLRTVHVDDGLFTDSPSAHARALSIDGLIVAPGFIDSQINGGWGRDFTGEPDAIWEVGERLPATGVTTFLPTIVTTTPRIYRIARSVLKEGPPAGYAGAHVLGAHFEGPWLSPDWSGAHDRDLLRDPDVAIADEWAASGVVAMVTIAPELPGAADVARVLDERRVVVSAGHSGAGYEMARDALEGSWSAVTHLFNRMSSRDHGEPGLAEAALVAGSYSGLIADGIHVSPETVRLTHDQLGDRLVLVTDGMEATGLPHGSYTIGGVPVVVDERGSRMRDGRLAGSVLTMDEAVRNLLEWTGVSLEEAVRAATAAPAGLLGLNDRGALMPGLRADLVVLEQDLTVKATLVAGAPVFDPDGLFATSG